MVKALFFDIDGTLISFNTHRVPESAISALKLAKANGVKVFISTGRPKPIICNLDQVIPLVDGFITANGAYNFIGDHEVNCETIHPDAVQQIIDYSKQIGVPCLVDGKQRIAVVNEDEHFNTIFRDMLKITTLDCLAPLDEVLAEGIIQMTPFFTDEQEQEAMAGIDSCTCGRWHPDFVDITAKGIDKGLGLERMANYLHFKMEETMAFGDGGNDIPIIEKAGIGVAMGNAGDNVKACADYITTHIDEDGVANALKHFGVI